MRYTLIRYCICGATLKCNPGRRTRQALSIWYSAHSGDGHADTTAAGAEMARMGAGVAYGREYEKQERTKQ